MKGPTSKSVENNDQSQDSLYGEWMVVTRPKKSAQNSGKWKLQGKCISCIKPSEYQKKETQSGTTNSLDSIPKIEFVSPFNKHQPGSQNSHGIQTMLNVDILTANRLRFRDEDDPGGHSPSSQPRDKEAQAMDSETVDGMDAVSESLDGEAAP
ncbi:peptidase M1 [Sesbania bispinosa]|nr:peptidase M1 [Sesbania bispinosa]